MINLRCLVVLIAAALAFVAVRASAQHHHPPQDAAIHEKFYRTWNMPDNPSVSCCNLRDCAPAAGVSRSDGRWSARRASDGRWFDIPEEKVEGTLDSPDGRSHLCVAFDRVLCFIPGSGI